MQSVLNVRHCQYQHAPPAERRGAALHGRAGRFGFVLATERHIDRGALPRLAPRLRFGGVQHLRRAAKARGVGAGLGRALRLGCTAAHVCALDGVVCARARSSVKALHRSRRRSSAVESVTTTTTRFGALGTRTSSFEDNDGHRGDVPEQQTFASVSFLQTCVAQVDPALLEL